MMRLIEFKNFKCFRHAQLPLNRLTVLAGLNGVGKSSVIQALLLLKQMNDERSATAFQGYWVDLGGFEDIYSFFAEDGEVSVKVQDAVELYFRLQADEGGKLSSSFYSNIPKKPFTAYSDFWFLSADRWGPRSRLPIAETRDDPAHVGKYGEFTAHYMYVNGGREIRNADMPAHPKASGRSLDEQVAAWLSEVTPGTRLNFSLISRADVSYSSFQFVAGKDVSPEFRPTNVGFGLSYALPVIIALLSARPGGLVLIENPEAHLHPAGQTALGRLLSMAAEAGVQVIVETHSDHLLDGIRIAARSGEIQSSNVAIHYFRRNEAGDSAFSSPRMTGDGKIDEWPEGFFDQSIINLARLGS